MTTHEIVAILSALTPLIQQTGILISSILAGLAYRETRRNATKIDTVQRQTNSMVHSSNQRAYERGKEHGLRECEDYRQIKKAKQNTAMEDAGETMYRIL